MGRGPTGSHTVRVTRPTTLLALLATLLLAATAGCGRTPSPTEGAVPTETVGLTVIPSEQREPAPELSGATSAGDQVAVTDLQGQPVIVNAWASWCAPCREEIPTLQRLARDNPRMKIIGVNVQDEPAAAQAFVSDLDVTWPSIVDPSGEVLSGIPGVPPKALPSTIVIDAQGRIAARVIGPVTPAMVPKLVAASKGN
jgi:thiol-disulfide isomerase/thioredoxin